MDYKWVVLTVTTVGIFMATLDASIIIVGLPTVVNDLHTNIVVGIWIITIYRLAITVLLVTIGRVADLFGRVRLYTWGFAIFTVGSLLSGLSPTAEFLLAFRLVQGTGAALLFVNGVAIVTDAFAGTGQLGKGIGLNQIAINAGTITGYTFSGILIVTPIIGWRSIFLVNVPVGIFGTYWSRKRLREISAPAAKEQFDIPGAVTFSGAITSLLLGLTLGGLDSPITVLLLLTSLVLTVIFLSIERHTKSPVLDLSLFKNRVFTIGNLSNLFSGLAFASLAFVMTLYFQLVRGFSAYNAGLALIPIIALVTAAVIQRSQHTWFIDRFDWFRTYVRIEYRYSLHTGRDLALTGWFRHRSLPEPKRQQCHGCCPAVEAWNLIWHKGTGNQHKHCR